MSTSTVPVKQRKAQDQDVARQGYQSVAVPDAPSAKRRSQGGIEGLIGKRVAAATEHALDGPNQKLMRAQKPVWDALSRFYFRLETSGWERLPQETSLLIGNHSGGSLTMDAWTFVYDWWRRFGVERVLHPTAHDVLMAAPGLGDYFRQVGVIPASRQGVTTALRSGCDVIIWPGGDVGAMRDWRVPIVLGILFGLTIESMPTHLPLPAKIRTELLDPIRVDHDPERVNDAPDVA